MGGRGILILMVGRGVGEWTGLKPNLGKRGEQGRRGVVNGAGWMMGFKGRTGRSEFDVGCRYEIN